MNDLLKNPAVKRLVEYLLAIGLAFLVARYGIQVQVPAPTVVTVDETGKVVSVEQK